MDWADCPLIEINPRKVSGAPVLKGTRMPADVVVENWEGGSTIAEIAENFDISEAEIHVLLEYAAKHTPAPKL